MSKQTIGLILGGFLPALIYGFGGVIQKLSIQTGIGTGLYLIISSTGALIVSILFYLFMPDNTISAKAGFLTLVIGATWAGGMALIAIALAKFDASLSKLAPLYNMNALITVILGLVILAEWKDLNVVKLIIGAVFIIIGGTLVANS